MTALLPQPPLERLVSYLKFEGWKLVSDNERWYILEGYEDIDGDPIEIILSKNDSTPDYRLYIQQTLDIVSSLTNKSPDVLAREVMHRERDILDTRIIDNTDITSTALKSAFNVVSGFKDLFVCATDSEQRDAKPFYQKAGSNPNRILDVVRFGHTFAGSFGYSIESPVKTQTDMFQAPLERRVMERIITGLVNADNAVKLADIGPLVNGYETGFSANMCDAILRTGDDHNTAIEYSVRWSEKYPVSDELRSVKCVQIDRNHYEFLQEASAKLREVQPKFVTIKGHVRNLRAPSDPQNADDPDRNVTIEWEMEEGISRKIVVRLESSEYAAAWNAHWNEQIVSVKGYIEGTKRQLSKPHDFKIIT
ncbi:MAG: hypothetical protein OXN88_13755 [Chloroflexota bacterium]|nr:hypothetical protein [Chloroflexota bacterium]